MHQRNCACTCVQGEAGYLPGQEEAISLILSINLGLWKEVLITDLRLFQKVAKKNSSTNEVSQFGPWVMHSFFLWWAVRHSPVQDCSSTKTGDSGCPNALSRLTFSIADC